MSMLSQWQIAYEMFKDWCKQVFGSGAMFPTAPGYVAGYSK